MKNIKTNIEKEFMDIGEDAKLTPKQAEQKYKDLESNIGKFSEEIPKIE